MVDEISDREDPEQRFRRLAQARYEQFSDVVRKISNLSNRTNYRYSNDDVRRLFDEMRKDIENAERMFRPSGIDTGKKLW